jgi:topoisomerase-4 subunit A
MAYLDSLYKTNFVEYASYVIKDRAIPHVDDGLKPVQRRILHALSEIDDGKFHKVANVVGQTMKYHPHGDQSIYSALVVLANKDLLIEKQGNFGNIFTGDEASAARYIECRLTPLAREVLFDPEITDYLPSYDARNDEPVLFPAKIPVLLTQGAEGIAVGMSTRILPHNFTELLQAQIAYMKDQPFEVFPDFPTAGLVDVSEYREGNGKVHVRARLDVSDPKRIVIREIPFATTSESLIASIEDAARKGKVKVSTIDDFTAEHVEIELKLARGVYAEEVVDALYAFTDCEVSLSLNLLVIADDMPRVMTVPEIVERGVDRLVDVLTAELRVEADKLRARQHAKTLEQIFIENRIYKEIEDKKSAAAVVDAVLTGLIPHAAKLKGEITRDDVDTLLKIPIRRISLYDINKAKQELKEIGKRLTQIAKDLKAIIPYSIAFLEKLIDQYGSQFPRRTQIVQFETVDVRDAAKRDLKLAYDKSTGYLGHAVDGDTQALVSPYDRVLVIRKDGSYSVVDVPDKLFVGKGMLHCGFVDKDLVFNALYKDAKGFGYIKRCRIDKFILNRMYSLVPDGCTLLKLSTDPVATISVDYKPKPRVRVLHEEFAIADYPVRGLKASGIRLATRELQSCKVIK